MEIKVLSVGSNQNIFYEVQYGDSFESVSKMFSVPVDYIKFNNPGTIYEGKVLFLPQVNFKSYIVQPFDTLAKIAAKFDVSLESLKLKNSLQSDYVFVGQKLYV